MGQCGTVGVAQDHGDLRSLSKLCKLDLAHRRWLGQNSKQGKLQRQLTDIQIRMRLRVSGSRQEIREQYMPMLAAKIVLPLTQQGAGASVIEETIDYMDEYFLGKEDWDAFVELGVDVMKEELILKKIPSTTKSSFTRL